VSAFATKPGRMPVASPLVRFQARGPGLGVTSLLHREIVIEDGLTHLVLALMDGTRDVEALALGAAGAVIAGGLLKGEDGSPVTDRTRVLAVVEEAMGRILDGAARNALLTA